MLSRVLDIPGTFFQLTISPGLTPAVKICPCHGVAAHSQRECPRCPKMRRKMFRGNVLFPLLVQETQLSAGRHILSAAAQVYKKWHFNRPALRA